VGKLRLPSEKRKEQGNVKEWRVNKKENKYCKLRYPKRRKKHLLPNLDRERRDKKKLGARKNDIDHKKPLTHRERKRG